jgi:TPR repeat protein
MKLIILFLALVLCGCTSSTVRSNKPSGAELFITAEGYCQKRNYEEALKYYRLAADQHYVPAYRALASLYHSGRLGSYNYDDAVKWLKKGIEQGDIGSSGRLGLHYLQGRSVERDDVKGREMLEMAAKNGDAFSQHVMGQISYDFNDSKPNKWFSAAAEQGNADAQCDLGNFFLRAKEYEDAFKWFEKAALQNHYDAQKSLVECYVNGWGTDIDPISALTWAYIKNDWSESDLPKDLNANMKNAVSARLTKLKHEIEQYRIDHWEECMAAHY